MAILLAFGIGFAAGLRTFMPVAALRFRDRDWTTVVAFVIAFGELIGDKLPRVPSRLSPGPFVGRCVVGGYAGLVVGGKLGLDFAPAVLIGLLGAAAGALSGASYRARVAAARLPDRWFALVEDAVAIAIAFSIALSVT
jgi:uncharacterized membrane protein